MPQIASVSRGALASTKINRISTEGASLTGVRVMSGNYVPGLTGSAWSSWIVDGIDRDYNTTTFKSRTNVTVDDGRTYNFDDERQRQRPYCFVRIERV